MSEKPEFTSLLNLAAEKLGAQALECTDDFFAPMENLIKPGRGIFIEDKYTENGKWMDGWESRRKRTEGHDWCVIKLGAPGIIMGFDVDTNHFLGNHPPNCAIEACFSETDEIANMKWTNILPKSALKPGTPNCFYVKSSEVHTHVKLHIFPDGGIARLKVYGGVCNDWTNVGSDDVVDLCSAQIGAKSILCSDMFFSHMDNILMPGRGINMGDGWETKRNRNQNNVDWVIIRLAHKGVIKNALIDTCHFKGNYPDTFSLDGALIPDETKLDNIEWKALLEQCKLEADNEHKYESEIQDIGAITHVRLNIYPDGGVSRLRLGGTISAASLADFNSLSKDDAELAFEKCCGSPTWVKTMEQLRPFASQDALFQAAKTCWYSCTDTDWIEAFKHHPKIGNLESIKEKFPIDPDDLEWAEEEQSGMDDAPVDLIEEIGRLNDVYELKFGYIFIVCATGKTAQEMLRLLQGRLNNDPDFELRIAMGEQAKITKLRLEKILT